MVTSLPGVQRKIRSFGMSENSRQPASPNQTGPSTQSNPVASCRSLDRSVIQNVAVEDRITGFEEGHS